jgi:hypothetical protein
MSEDQKVVTTIAEPVHITLTKNTKGYQWEISVHEKNLESALTTVDIADAELKHKYGGEEKPV